MVALTEDVLFSCRHVVDCGQQKSDGKSPPQGLRPEIPPQVAVSALANSLRSSNGSNSSGIHATPADAVGRRYLRANASAYLRAEGDIMRVL